MQLQLSSFEESQGNALSSKCLTEVYNKHNVRTHTVTSLSCSYAVWSKHTLGMLLGSIIHKLCVHQFSTTVYAINIISSIRNKLYIYNNKSGFCKFSLEIQSGCLWPWPEVWKYWWLRENQPEMQCITVTVWGQVKNIWVKQPDGYREQHKP